MTFHPLGTETGFPFTVKLIISGVEGVGVVVLVAVIEDVRFRVAFAGFQWRITRIKAQAYLRLAVGSLPHR